MSNTQIPELSDEQVFEVYTRPDFQFNEWLNKVVAGEVDLVTKEDEAAFNGHFQDAKQGVLRYMFYAFAAGMQAASNLFEALVFNEESSVDTAIATETAK